MHEEVKALKQKDSISPFWIIFISAFFVIFPTIGLHPLWNRDDSRRAEIAREMVELKEYVVPHLYYVPYLEKPIFNTWMIAFSLEIFGINEWGARISLGLFAFFSVLLLFWWTRKIYGPKKALWSSFILLTSVEFLALSHFLTTDMYLLFWILLGFFSFQQYLFSRNKNGEFQYPAWAALLGTLALSFSILTKGLVGLVVVAMPLFFYLLYFREKRFLLAFPWLRAILLAFLILFPWHYAIFLKQKEFFSYFYWKMNIMAFFNKKIHHSAPWYSTFFYLLGGFMPWTLLGILGLYHTRKNFFQRQQPESLIFFWLFFDFLFFTFSKAKLATYIFPLLPLLAIFSISILDNNIQKWEKAVWIFQLAGIALAACIVLPVFYFIILPKRPLPIESSFYIFSGMALFMLFCGSLICIFFAWKGTQWKDVLYPFVLAFTIITLPLFSSLPYISKIKSSKAMCLKLQKIWKPGDQIYIFHDRDYSALFYLKKRIPHIGALAEIRYGATLKPDPKYFLPYSVIPKLLSQKENRVFITMHRKDYLDKWIHKYKHLPSYLIIEEGNYLVVSNFP